MPPYKIRQMIRDLERKCEIIPKNVSGQKQAGRCNGITKILLRLYNKREFA